MCVWVGVGVGVPAVSVTVRVWVVAESKNTDPLKFRQSARGVYKTRQPLEGIGAFKHRFFCPGNHPENFNLGF